MYRTSNVARLAGAMSLPVLLVGWGFVSLLVSGETTMTTWALGLALLLPASVLSLAVVPRRAGLEYLTGLVAGVATLSVAYVALAVVNRPAARAIAAFDSVELVAVAVLFALCAGTLALVDRLYVARPETAARLEARYLDEPVGGD